MLSFKALFCLEKDVPEYNPEMIKSYSNLRTQESWNRWCILLDDKVSMQRYWNKPSQLHCLAPWTCHLRSQNSPPLCLATWTLRKPQSISNWCLMCTKVNAKTLVQLSQDTITSEFWELDVSEVKPGLYYRLGRDLSILNGNGPAVAKKFIMEIIPI